MHAPIEKRQLTVPAPAPLKSDLSVHAVTFDVDIAYHVSYDYSTHCELVHIIVMEHYAPGDGHTRQSIGQ